MLRKAALDDIVEVVSERGFDVPRFIQDRTVIEDTESTIDLVAKDWSLHNHQERLSYSATPADGGSLLIERRRWSNGGLLIFPKPARHDIKELFRGRVRPTEMLLKSHYLISPTLSNVGILLLFFAPLGDSKLSVWIPAICGILLLPLRFRSVEERLFTPACSSRLRPQSAPRTDKVLVAL